MTDADRKEVLGLIDSAMRASATQTRELLQVTVRAFVDHVVDQEAAQALPIGTASKLLTHLVAQVDPRGLVGAMLVAVKRDVESGEWGRMTPEQRQGRLFAIDGGLKGRPPHDGETPPPAAP